MGAIIFRRNRVLLVERGREPLKGYWSLPGGALETGELLDAAIRREVLEETGLRVVPMGVFEIYERIMKDKAGQPEYHYVLVDYMCRVAGGELAAADDASRADWIPCRDLEKYRITEGTVDVIQRAYARRKEYR